MASELYQLVAIDRTGHEYVIELKNDNKNNKGQLNVIDYGTASFANEKYLANYLYNSGKIPTIDVSFSIKYSRNGVRYLPVIYNDGVFKHAVKDLDDKKYGDLQFYILTKFEEHLNHPDFYRFISLKNQKNSMQNSNGNYLNNKFIENMNNYYNSYIRTNNIDIDRSEFRIPLSNEISKSYKSFRTLYLFIKEYDQAFKEKVREYESSSEKIK